MTKNSNTILPPLPPKSEYYHPNAVPSDDATSQNTEVSSTLTFEWQESNELQFSSHGGHELVLEATSEQNKTAFKEFVSAALLEDENHDKNGQITLRLHALMKDDSSKNYDQKLLLKALEEALKELKNEDKERWNKINAIELGNFPLSQLPDTLTKLEGLKKFSVSENNNLKNLETTAEIVLCFKCNTLESIVNSSQKSQILISSCPQLVSVDARNAKSVLTNSAKAVFLISEETKVSEPKNDLAKDRRKSSFSKRPSQAGQETTNNEYFRIENGNSYGIRDVGPESTVESFSKAVGSRREEISKALEQTSSSQFSPEISQSPKRSMTFRRPSSMIKPTSISKLDEKSNNLENGGSGCCSMM